MIRILRTEAAFFATAISAAIVYTVGKDWFDRLDSPLVLAILFLWLFGVMTWGAFAVVRHADSVAELLGEPLGTLVLTISVISIEVSIIAAVMLHAGPNPTLARDTMLAVLVIVLDGMVGLSLLVGGIRHREQGFNLQGARAYLSVLITLATMTLVLPRFTASTSDPSLTTVQGLIFAVITVFLYATFLAMQTIRHRQDFAEPPGPGEEPAEPEDHAAHGGHGPRSLAYHAVFLILTLVPIVLLSKKLAVIVDYGTDALGLPAALGGVLVAILVLSPEALAALEAAAANRLQRAVNICLGSALATISLTVPAVIIIAGLSGMRIQLGLDPAEMVVLILTLIVGTLTFGGVRTNMLQGAVHLVIFVVYVVLIFQP